MKGLGSGVVWWCGHGGDSGCAVFLAHGTARLALFAHTMTAAQQCEPGGAAGHERGLTCIVACQVFVSCYSSFRFCSGHLCCSMFASPLALSLCSSLYRGFASCHCVTLFFPRVSRSATSANTSLWYFRTSFLFSAMWETLKQCVWPLLVLRAREEGRRSPELLMFFPFVSSDNISSFQNNNSCFFSKPPFAVKK